MYGRLCSQLAEGRHELLASPRWPFSPDILNEAADKAFLQQNVFFSFPERMKPGMIVF